MVRGDPTVGTAQGYRPNVPARLTPAALAALRLAAQPYPPHRSWRVLRRRTLARDRGRCRWTHDGVRCREPASTVVLVVPWREGGQLVDGNAWSVCEHHGRTWRGLVANAGGHREAVMPPTGRARRLARLLATHRVDPMLGRRHAAVELSKAVGYYVPADNVLTWACAWRRWSAPSPFPPLVGYTRPRRPASLQGEPCGVDHAATGTATRLGNGPGQGLTSMDSEGSKPVAT